MTRSPYQPGPETGHYHDTLGVAETPISELGGEMGAHATDTTGIHGIADTAELVTNETLEAALADIDFPEPVVNNFVTNIATNETFVTELVTNETYVTELVTNETFVTELVTNETYVTELVTNSTFVTELVTNETYVTQLVTQIFEGDEADTYVTQLTENNTYITNNTTQINANINGKKGIANELATLDGTGHLTASQIPPSLLGGSTSSPVSKLFAAANFR